MRYVSTRGHDQVSTFSDVLLAGLARDGGLYVPDVWPWLSPETIAGFAGRPYHEVATAVIGPFLGDAIPAHVLAAASRDSYATFRHPAVAPLVQLSPRDFLLELFHGPTLAFKDVAMQLVARLMDHVLRERGERVTIVGATSGDTGSAAIEAFRGIEAADIVILFPKGRVSEVQRRQMTGVDAPNVHAVAIEGTFDDAQALVKAMFNHHAFRDRVRLAGINSINWARIVAQIVYYFTAAVALGGPTRRVAFSVPTGNFGDVFAGYVATRMGLPVERLIVGTNVNDILARALSRGRYEVRNVTMTQSPSMDIQISSNFERLLFDTLDRDGSAVAALMGSLAQSRGFDLGEASLTRMGATFSAHSTDERQTAETMRRVHAEAGLLIDPHTAVALHAAEREPLAPEVPVVTLATAHPAKFPDAVEAATGLRPALPAHLADLLHRREHMTVLPNDLAVIERFVEERSRAVGAAA